MDEGLGAVLIALLSGIGLTGLFLATAALFPRVVDRTRRTADRSPGRSFVVGFVNIFFLGAIGLGFSALADGTGLEFLQLPALLIYSLLVILLGFGLTALSQMTGARLIPDSHPVRQHVLGTWALILGGLTPFIGWFAFFPYLAIVGTGAVLLGTVRARGGQSQTKSSSSDSDQANGDSV